MNEAAAAGWYPDPDDDSSERWWGGTDWTANVRPLNRAPAASSEPQARPAVAGSLLPAAGWYPDPENAAGERWFDGAAWARFKRQRAGDLSADGSGQPDLGDLLGEPGDQLQQAARNPAGFSAPRQGGAGTTVGPLLVAGLPSRNRIRGGVFSSLFGLFIGLVFVWAGCNPPANMSAPSNMSARVVGIVASVQVPQPAPISRSAKSTGAGCVPVVDFEVGGKPYKATASMGVSPCPWRIGQAATVAYDPNSPASAMVPTSDGPVQYLPKIFSGIGALVTLVFLFNFVRSVAQLGVGGSMLRRARRRRNVTTPAA